MLVLRLTYVFMSAVKFQLSAIMEKHLDRVMDEVYVHNLPLTLF